MFVEKHAGPAFLAAYLAIAMVFFLRGYVYADATFWMGIVLIPFLLRSFPPGKKSWRLAPAVVVMVLICGVRQEFSWRFLLLVIALLFTIESLFGRLNGLFFAVLLIISPIFKYFSQVFTFPIRLQISACAGSLLQMTGIRVTVVGNNIVLNGSEFSVDAPCMGLQTTGFALLSAIFLTAQFQATDQKSLPAWNQAGVIAIAFVLNIAGNLIRIMMLVMLKILPDTALHDMVGVVCLLAYVVVPLIFIIRKAHWRFGRPIARQDASRKGNTGYPLIAHLTLLLICAFFCLQKAIININPLMATAFPHPQGYVVNQLISGVIQFRSQNALVYIKPIPSFYSSEHNPVTCWTGSGYHLSRISKKHIAGIAVYTGSLQKGGDELHTAWWFSDGQYATISQLDWRWKSLTKNSTFKLINITASSPKLLDIEVKRWLHSI